MSQWTKRMCKFSSLERHFAKATKEIGNENNTLKQWITLQESAGYVQESGPNQTKLPQHYIRRQFRAETHLELSDEELCDKCLFEIERYVFSVKELIEMWVITCEYDKCTQPANFYNCTGQCVCYMCYVRTNCQIHCSVCTESFCIRLDTQLLCVVKCESSTLNLNTKISS